MLTRKVDAPICPYANFRYLYQPGELEGGKRRATDPIWSVDIHKLIIICTQGIRVYYLKAPAPKRGFVKGSCSCGHGTKAVIQNHKSINE